MPCTTNIIASVNYRTQILGEDENADFKFKPQCLITSCKACVFVEDLVPSEQSPCVSCEVDDEECIIAYGQCVMRYMKFIEVKVSTLHCCLHTVKARVDILITALSVDASSYISAFNSLDFFCHYAAIGKFTISQR